MMTFEPNFTAGPYGRVSVKDLFRGGAALNKVFTSLLYSLLSWPRGLFGLSVNCCRQSSLSSASLISLVFLLVKTNSPWVLSSSPCRAEKIHIYTLPE